MKRYESYKDSGIKWIGEIPSHWEIRKIKYLFKERSQKGFPNEPVLCSTQKYGVIPQSMYENRVVVVNKGLDGLKLVRKGDFVISLRSFQGGIEYAHYQGIISAAYKILILVDNISPQYIKHLFKSMPFIGLLKTCVTGIREGQNINYDVLRKNKMMLPSLSEQQAIADYLQAKTSKIEQYVAERERERELLEQLKQSEIANVVTKGLNPDVPMKDSGIPWIGKIPAHWKAHRNKDIFTESKKVVGENSASYTLLSLTKQGVIIRDLSESKGKFPKEFNNYKVVEPNDIIFCLFDVDETPRTVGLSNHYGMITGAYDIFKIRRVLPQYVLYYYLSIDDRKALRPLYKGLRKVVPMPSFMSSKIFLPPLEEQQAIVDYIDGRLAKIDQCIADLTAEIEYIKEFKQRLISDAVTGQIKVID